jgi:plastocyanin
MSAAVTGRAGGIAYVLLFAAFGLAAPAVMTVRHLDTGGNDAGNSRGAADPPAVEMRNLKFQPATLTIKRGSEVTFTNRDVAPHTVTAADGQPDSGLIPPGASFNLRVDEPLDYVCTVHPSMRATIELSG